jgi:class 3 adenylate cyclase
MSASTPDKSPVSPPADQMESASLHSRQTVPAQAGALPTRAQLPFEFGRYVLEEIVGEGGMGVVYRAHDTKVGRLVALKIPRLHAGQAEELRLRFQLEAVCAAHLRHPNICMVHDFDEHEGLPFFTMPLLEGQTLDSWVQVTNPSLEKRLRLVVTLARALDEAHRHDLYHRDLKPSNVFIDRFDTPILLDFGLVLPRPVESPELARLTGEHRIMGTPPYMAPEQVRPSLGAVGAHTDQYSLGIILFELITGQRPFSGDPSDMIVALASRPVPSVRLFRADLDLRLDTIVRRATARNPGDRFPRLPAFADALEQYLGGGSIPGTITGAMPLLGPASFTWPTNPAGWIGAAGDALAEGEGVGRLGLEPFLVPEVVTLLRHHGWAVGIARIRTRSIRSLEERERAAWRAYHDCLSGERHSDDEALSALRDLPGGAALLGWGLAGRASLRLRERLYPTAHAYLDRALREGDTADIILQATIAHTRGVCLFHEGRGGQALPFLNLALQTFGPGHPATGRVLDTLGSVYGSRGHFHLATEFFEQSIRAKEQHGDENGIALSHGQLGRLNLDWGNFDEAEWHFQEDLRLAQKVQSKFSEAQMYNHLGQVALARGDHEARQGKRAQARRHWLVAAGWLDEAIRRAQEGKFTLAEGYARKDRALVHLALNEDAQAEEQLHEAGLLFRGAGFPEGQAQLHRVEGLLLSHRGQYEEAGRALRLAMAHFEEVGERDEAARIQWDIARTLHAAALPSPLVVRAYRDALTRAEECRQTLLVRAIEAEFQEVDPEAYLRHVYQRVRGLSPEEDSPTLGSAATEVVTLLLLDLPDFATAAAGRNPDAVLTTLNQLLADLSPVLETQEVEIVSYRGCGLLTLARGARHAERAVTAALEVLDALAAFNQPRAVLKLPLFEARIALNTGTVLRGNVGTYRKLDAGLVGEVVEEVERILQGIPAGTPFLTNATLKQAGSVARIDADNHRYIPLASGDELCVWALQSR